MITIRNSSVYQGPLRLAILDLAGTVLDFGSRAPLMAFIELFARRGLTLTEAEARGPMGMGKRDHIAALCSLPAVQQQWEEANGANISNADIDSLYADFIPLQLAMLPQFSTLIPGALEAVSAMRQQGLQIALTTGYNRAMLDVILASAAAQGLQWDCALCSSDIPHSRPAPWMALECARQLNVYPPSACIKIGDTRVDIQEGRNAGMWSVGVTITGNMVGLTLEQWTTLTDQEQTAYRQAAAEALYQAGAHAVADNLLDCLPLIRTINAYLSQGQNAN